MMSHATMELPRTDALFLPAIGPATAIYEISDDDARLMAKADGSGDSGGKQVRPKPKDGGGNDTGGKKPG